MSDIISFAVIVVAILLVITVLLQARGGSAGLFGSAGTTFRTRRGVEKTLFQFTLGLGVIFVVLALVNVRFG